MQQMHRQVQSLALLDAIEADCQTSPRVQHFRALNLLELKELEKALIAAERQVQLVFTIMRNSRKMREYLPQDFVKDLLTSLEEQLGAYENLRTNIEREGAGKLDEVLVQHLITELNRELGVLKLELEHHRKVKLEIHHQVEALLETLKQEHGETAEGAEAPADTSGQEAAIAKARLAHEKARYRMEERLIAEVQHAIQLQEKRITGVERLLGKSNISDLPRADSSLVKVGMLLVSLVSGFVFMYSLTDGATQSRPQRQQGQQQLQSERVLHFPEAWSMGTLYVRDTVAIGEAEWIPYADEAQGRITVNDRLQVHLRMSEAGAERLDVLRSLPRNSLHSIWLPAFDLNDENLAVLQHFTSLEALVIESATDPEILAQLRETLPNIQLNTLPPDAIVDAESRTPPEAQRLVFPGDSVGQIQVRPFTLASSAAWELHTQAQGVVNTPEGHEVKLILNPAAGSDLSFLTEMPPDALHTLTLTGAQVANAGMEHVRQLTGLRGLELRNTAVNDEGLLRLSVLSHLEEVTLLNINMTDTGFAVFVNFPNMRILVIRQAQLTNRSIPLIRQMRGLRILHLERSGISREGLITLRFDLPQASVTPLDS